MPAYIRQKSQIRHKSPIIPRLLVKHFRFQHIVDDPHSFQMASGDNLVDEREFAVPQNQNYDVNGGNLSTAFSGRSFDASGTTGSCRFSHKFRVFTWKTVARLLRWFADGTRSPRSHCEASCGVTPTASARRLMSRRLGKTRFRSCRMLLISISLSILVNVVMGYLSCCIVENEDK